MAEVSCSVGFTLNLGNYQSARYEMTVSGIDTTAPLEPQLEAAHSHLLGTAAWVEEHLYKQLRENNLISAVRGRE